MAIKKIIFFNIFVMSMLYSKDISKILNKTNEINNNINNINLKLLKKETEYAKKLLSEGTLNKIKQKLNKKFFILNNYKEQKLMFFENKQSKNNLISNKKIYNIKKDINKNKNKTKNNINNEKGIITPLIYFNNKLYINYKLINLSKNKIIFDKNIWIKKNQKIKKCKFIKIINNNTFEFKCNKKIKIYNISPKIKK